MNFLPDLNAKTKKVKKQVGLYEVESINNPNIITLAVNPKEYFEVFRSKEINKKHKGVKKNTPGMTFESFASRIMDIREYTYLERNPQKIKQKRFQVKKAHMQMTTVSRNQFGLLILFDRWCYLSALWTLLINVSKRRKKEIQTNI